MTDTIELKICFDRDGSAAMFAFLNPPPGANSSPGIYLVLKYSKFELNLLSNGIEEWRFSFRSIDDVFYFGRWYQQFIQNRHQSADQL